MSDYNDAATYLMESALVRGDFQGLSALKTVMDMKAACCEDCGLSYSEFGLDTTIPDDQWLVIHPEGMGGLLCAKCIVKRASKLLKVIAARMVIEFAEASK